MNPRAGLGLSAPALGATALLVLLPLVGTLLLAMTHFDALSAAQWTGLDNFRALSADPTFRLALRNSVELALVAVPLRLGIALAIALLIASPSRLARASLLPVLLPILLPDIVWATGWLWILNPHFGPAAAGLEAWHPDGSAWLLGAAGARSSILLVISFLVGELVLVLVAARRQIPAQHYAVCAVEGASHWYAFRHITLPALWPLLLVLAARDFALSLQLAIVPALVITKGGPLFATFYLPQYIYENAFEYLRFGYAAALSCVILLVVVAVAVAQAEALRRWLR